MKKIILKTDSNDSKSHEDLIEDVSLLRDILLTIHRDYHNRGEDKFDDVLNQLNTLKSEKNSLVKYFEEVKNDFSKTDSIVESYGKVSKELSEKVKTHESRVEKLYEGLSERLDKVEKIVDSVVSSYEEMDVPDDTFSSLVIRVSKIVKKIEEIEKNVNESTSEKFLKMFKGGSK